MSDEYRHISNPCEITIFKIAPDSPLWEVAQEMADFSETTGKDCIAIFNSRTLIATPGISPKDLLAQFDAGMKNLFARND